MFFNGFMDYKLESFFTVQYRISFLKFKGEGLSLFLEDIILLPGSLEGTRITMNEKKKTFTASWSQQ